MADSQFPWFAPGKGATPWNTRLFTGGNDRRSLHLLQRGRPAGVIHTGSAIAAPQGQTCRLPLQSDIELMMEEGVLGLKAPSRLEQIGDKNWK
jgi:hypothetical protein